LEDASKESQEKTAEKDEEKTDQMLKNVKDSKIETLRLKDDKDQKNTKAINRNKRKKDKESTSKSKRKRKNLHGLPQKGPIPRRHRTMRLIRSFPTLAIEARVGKKNQYADNSGAPVGPILTNLSSANKAMLSAMLFLGRVQRRAAASAGAMPYCFPKNTLISTTSGLNCENMILNVRFQYSSRSHRNFAESLLSSTGGESFRILLKTASTLLMRSVSMTGAATLACKLAI
jgi:hypothetical protein